MRELLPSSAVVVETEGIATPAAKLLPEEAWLLDPHTVVSRVREFATGRDCARRALSLLGAPAGAIGVGASREPRWPRGVMGSITHTDAYCAAAVAWRDDIASLGIDAERHAPLPPSMADLVCTSDEQAWIQRVGTASVRWDTVLFSAKESIYKAWFPVTRRSLSFHDVTIVIEPPGSFRVQPTSPGLFQHAGRRLTIHGRFAVRPRRIETVAILAPCRARRRSDQPHPTQA